MTIKKVEGDIRELGKLLLLPLLNTGIMLVLVCVLKRQSRSVIMFFSSAIAGGLVYVAITGLFNRLFAYDMWYILRRAREELRR